MYTYIYIYMWEQKHHLLVSKQTPVSADTSIERH